MEEVVVLAVEHVERWHGDSLAHHVGQGKHCGVRVDFKQFLHNLGVGHLVALLVGGDEAADLGEGGVAVELGVAGGVAVGDEGGLLLERSVDEPAVGVAVDAYMLEKKNNNNSKKNKETK